MKLTEREELIIELEDAEERLKYIEEKIEKAEDERENIQNNNEKLKEIGKDYLVECLEIEMQGFENGIKELKKEKREEEEYIKEKRLVLECLDLDFEYKIKRKYYE